VFFFSNDCYFNWPLFRYKKQKKKHIHYRWCSIDFSRRSINSLSVLRFLTCYRYNRWIWLFMRFSSSIITKKNLFLFLFSLFFCIFSSSVYINRSRIDLISITFLWLKKKTRTMCNVSSVWVQHDKFVY